MYFIYLLVFLLNIIAILELTKKGKKKKILNNAAKIIKHLGNINIIVVSINILYYIAMALFGINIDGFGVAIDVLLSVVLIILSFYYNKYKGKANEIVFVTNKKDKKEKLIIFYIIAISMVLSGRVGDSLYNYDIVMIKDFICIMLAIVSIFLILKFIFRNKAVISYGYSDEDFIPDIKYYKKIDLKIVYNYIIYIFMYLILMYCNFPYVYILLSIISLILLHIISKKYKKISLQHDKLYKNISIVKDKPGRIYAFEFEKDIYKLNNFENFVLIFTLSFILFYTFGYYSFTCVTIQMYILFIYNMLGNKIKLIKSIYSLNSNFIDKKRYKVKLNVEVSKIEVVNVSMFNNICFYKLIYSSIDNLYESNIILYDPELYIKKIDIYTNTKDIEDYVVVTEDLYI